MGEIYLGCSALIPLITQSLVLITQPYLAGQGIMGSSASWLETS